MYSRSFGKHTQHIAHKCRHKLDGSLNWFKGNKILTGRDVSKRTSHQLADERTREHRQSVFEKSTCDPRVVVLTTLVLPFWAECKTNVRASRVFSRSARQDPKRNLAGLIARRGEASPYDQAEGRVPWSLSAHCVFRVLLHKPSLDAENIEISIRAPSDACLKQGGQRSGLEQS